MVLAFENTLASHTNNPHNAVHAVAPKDSQTKRDRILAGLGDQKRLCKGIKLSEQNFEMDGIFGGLLRGEHSPATKAA